MCVQTLRAIRRNSPPFNKFLGSFDKLSDNNASDVNKISKVILMPGNNAILVVQRRSDTLTCTI